MSDPRSPPSKVKKFVQLVVDDKIFSLVVGDVLPSPTAVNPSSWSSGSELGQTFLKFDYRPLSC